MKWLTRLTLKLTKEIVLSLHQCTPCLSDCKVEVIRPVHTILSELAVILSILSASHFTKRRTRRAVVVDYDVNNFTPGCDSEDTR